MKNIKWQKNDKIMIHLKMITKKLNKYIDNKIWKAKNYKKKTYLSNNQTNFLNNKKFNTNKMFYQPYFKYKIFQ